MNEILLQTIVEKLESLEIALLKESNAGKDDAMQNQIIEDFKSFQSEVGKFTSQLNTNNKTLNGFSKEISALRILLSNPKENHVKHTRHFYEHVLLTVSLFIISLLLAYGWINCHNEKKGFEANDIKYRYWKTDSNASLLKLTYYTDSLYDMDKDGFTNHVIHAEQQFAEQEKQFRLAGEKEKEGRELKLKGQKSPLK
jgi:hypothetical protein